MLRYGASFRKLFHVSIGSGVLTFLALAFWKWCYSTLQFHYCYMFGIEQILGKQISSQFEGGRPQSDWPSVIWSTCNSKWVTMSASQWRALQANWLWNMNSNMALGTMQLKTDEHLISYCPNAGHVPPLELRVNRIHKFPEKVIGGSKLIWRFSSKLGQKLHIRNFNQSKYAFQPLLILQDSCPM